MRPQFNSHTAKIAAFYILGAVAGAFAGKLIVDRVLEKDEENGEWIQGTLEEFSEYDAEQGQKDMAADYAAESGEMPPVVFKEPKKGKTPVKFTDYSNAVKHARAKAAIQEVASKSLGEEAVSVSDEEIDHTMPYIISLEDYAMGYENHAKVTLTYYANDDTLVDDHDEKVITDPDKLIGENALVSFGQKSGDVDCVYIRSIKDMTDYEISRIRQAYTVAVLGMKPEPEKKASKPRTRKVKNIDAEAEEE